MAKSKPQLSPDLVKKLFEIIKGAGTGLTPGQIETLISHISPEIAEIAIRNPSSVDWKANADALFPNRPKVSGAKAISKLIGSPAAGEPTGAVRGQSVSPPLPLEAAPSKQPKSKAEARAEQVADLNNPPQKPQAKTTSIAAVVEDYAEEFGVNKQTATTAFKSLPPDVQAELASSGELAPAKRAEILEAHQPQMAEALKRQGIDVDTPELRRARVESLAKEVGDKDPMRVVQNVEQTAPKGKATKGVLGASSGLDPKKQYWQAPPPQNAAKADPALGGVLRALGVKVPGDSGADKLTKAVQKRLSQSTKDLGELRKAPLPAGADDAKAVLKQLVKGGSLKLGAEERKVLTHIIGSGLAGGRGIDEIVETAKAGRATPPGRTEKFFKSFFGTGTDSFESTAAYKAETELAKAVGGKATGKLAKAGRMGREALRHPGKLLLGGLLGLTAMGLKEGRDEAEKIRSTPVLTADEIKRRLEMNQKIAARKVALSKDPEMMNDVIRVLSGGEPARLTENEVEIGRIQQKKRPDEVQGLLNQLLLGLEQVDTVNAPAGLPF